MIRTYRDGEDNIQTEIDQGKDKALFLIEVGSTIASLMKILSVETMRDLIYMIMSGMFPVNEVPEEEDNER